MNSIIRMLMLFNQNRNKGKTRKKKKMKSKIRKVSVMAVLFAFLCQRFRDPKNVFCHFLSPRKSCFLLQEHYRKDKLNVNIMDHEMMFPSEIRSSVSVNLGQEWRHSAWWTPHQTNDIRNVISSVAINLYLVISGQPLN